MDRFAMQCALGYVSAEQEAGILADQADHHPVDSLQSVASREDLLALMAASRAVRFSEELRNYVVALVSATRGHRDIQLPASPRASLALMKTAQALSLFEGRDFVIPETIQEVAVDVIAHRLVLEPEARYSGTSARAIVADLIERTPVPV